MKKSRFSETKIVEILKEHDTTGKTAEICRRDGIHPNAPRNWKAKYGGLEVSDIVRMTPPDARRCPTFGPPPDPPCAEHFSRLELRRIPIASEGSARRASRPRNGAN